jgi:hypothetical protein
VSEITQNAEIRFENMQDGTNVYRGALYYKKKRLISFREWSFMGYGTRAWSETSDDSSIRHVVSFAGNVPAMAAPLNSKRSPEAGMRRVLIVGLGSYLWYGGKLRGDEVLYRAAEGFWRPTIGCD